MSASLVKIRILEKEKTSVSLEIKIINPAEYYFYAKKNFAIQVIWEAVQIYDNPECPLAKAISLDQISDTEWVLANESKFIKEVKIMSTKNYPDSGQLKSMDRASFDEFRKKNGIPEAIFDVEVTDPKWIKHIRKGMEWESASYDMSD